MRGTCAVIKDLQPTPCRVGSGTWVCRQRRSRDVADHQPAWHGTDVGCRINQFEKALSKARQEAPCRGGALRYIG